MIGKTPAERSYPAPTLIIMVAFCVVTFPSKKCLAKVMAEAYAMEEAQDDFSFP